ENVFAGGVAWCSDGLAAEDGPGRQRQHRRKICHGAFARVLQINKAGGVLVGTSSRLAWTNPCGLEVNLTGRHTVCPCDSKTFLRSAMDPAGTVYKCPAAPNSTRNILFLKNNIPHEIMARGPRGQPRGRI